MAFRAQFRFEWKDVYAIGVRLIDEQHKKLFSLINAFSELPETEKARPERQKLAAGIAAFTREHFDTEEKLMRTHGYPELDRHRSEHDELFASVQETAKTLVPPVGSADLATFLKDWLVDHTLQEDKKLAPFFASRGVT